MTTAMSDVTLHIFAGIEEREDATLDIAVSRGAWSRVMLDIDLSDGTLTSDAMMDIELSDGNKTQDVGLDIMAVNMAPTFQAVNAIQLSSVMEEIT